MVALAADKLLLKMSTRSVRPLQDFCSWSAFGTAAFWQEVYDHPDLAQELMCRWVNGLGAINPNEPTSADVAAHAAAAQYGYPQCVCLSDAVVQEVYDSVKAPICARIHAQLLRGAFLVLTRLHASRPQIMCNVP
jgi:hypothetical protein